MTNSQFRVLYRQFLFRVIDLEILSSKGDTSRLLGRLAGSLLSFTAVLAVSAIITSGDSMSPWKRLMAVWGMEHFLIATTMLIVGVFAVLGWDSTFPNKRDVLVLAPLPVHTRTLFLSKVTAIGAALFLVVASLHVGAGFTWPFHFSFQNTGGPLRSIAAYWITMLAAGLFIFCCVLAIQGLMALLPRGLYLRTSSLVQIAAFCLFLSVYILQPALAAPQAFVIEANHRTLSLLPSYWFLALFHVLNGSCPPESQAILATLTKQAWMGLSIAAGGAAAAFLLSYFRTLRRIAEEPDILPASRGLSWLPRFGDSFKTAIVQFALRTLQRSRQHRVILAFYVGIGFAIMILMMKTPRVQQQLTSRGIDNQMGLALLASSIVMLCLCILGTRVVFTLPLDLRANWIFQVTLIRGPAYCLKASRRALLVLAVLPVSAISAVWMLTIWPWRQAVGHLAVLLLLGTILSNVCLYGFRKIPFTCSYLPGKSNHQFVFFFCLGAFVLLVNAAVQWEYRVLQDFAAFMRTVAVLALVAAVARRITTARGKSEEASVLFEDDPEPVITVLGLSRDGIVPAAHHSA